MTLSTTVLSAVSGLAKSLPDAFIASTVFDKDTSVYDVSTAKKVYSERSCDVLSFIDRFKADEIDGKIVKNYDVKLVVIPKVSTGFDFVFSSVDRIMVGQQNYSVVVAIPQYVSDVIVSYTFHVRPQGVE